MSRGQKPRNRVFYPRMKVRRPHRRRPWMLVLYDADRQPYWYRKGSIRQRPNGFYIGDGTGPEIVTFQIPGGFRWSGKREVASPHPVRRDIDFSIALSPYESEEA